ncbi:BAG family molecular chaperone regulator 4 isoform X2 [Protopterus annectens]|uniref:BAG family molecular chaperone regulator 4 isoform X2 n=1 Tax=Protopterus annectens TaxID=7888 RepID=UPI001CFB4D10|nr:BAG family molecular chaperone regulator 4 isoform X2 [Protopterus annectens]
MASNGYLSGEVHGSGVVGSGGSGPNWGVHSDQRGTGPGWHYYGNPAWLDASSSGSGTQEVPSRAYPNYWNSAGPTYPATYMPGTEAQGQIPYGQQVVSPYMNGVSSSAYTPNTSGSCNQHYPSVYHPPNSFYTHGQQLPAPYQAQPPASHQCPTSSHLCTSHVTQPSAGPFAGVTSSGSRVTGYQPYPGQETLPGATMYPYRNVNTNILPQTTYSESHCRTPTETACGHSPTCGPSVSGMPQPQPTWPPAPSAAPALYGNPFIASPTSSSSSGGIPQTTYYSKDNTYHMHPGMNRTTYLRGAEESAGTVSGVPYANTHSKTHYVNPPQLYKTEQNHGAQNICGQELTSDSSSGVVHLPGNLRSHLGVQKIEQVLQRADTLDKEVNNFMGRKTDKEYRCLEELLTKELLELDSVETDGHDVVRQLRKDAVRKIQWILEKLDMKGL